MLLDIFLMHRHLLVLFLLFFLYTTALSQRESLEPSYSTMWVAKDIPNNNVTAITQDTLGYMWIATRNGLFRYDGIRYKPFKNAPGKEKKISFNMITGISLVHNRFLVIEGLRALNIIDAYSEQLIYESPSDKVFLQSINDGDQWYFQFEDKTFSNYLYRLTQDGQLELLPLELPSGVRMNKACFCGPGALYFFDLKGRFWKTRFDEQAQLTLLDSIQFFERTKAYPPPLFCDKKNQVWALDNQIRPHNSAYRLTPEGQFLKEHNLVQDLILIPDNTENVLWMIDPQDYLLCQMDLSSGDKKIFSKLPLPIISVTTVFKDRLGNVWIGTQFGPHKGVLLSHPHVAEFKKFLYQPGKEFSIGTACRSISNIPSGNLLIGGRDGFFSWNKSTNTTKKINPTDVSDKTTFFNVWDVISNPLSNTVWFTKEEGGLFRFNIDSGMVYNYRPKNNASDRYLGIAMGEKDKIWIGTRSGVSWFDTNTQNHDPLEKHSSRFYDVSGYKWVSADDNHFWLCSSNGLYLFNKERDVVKRYATDTEPFLFTNEVNDIVRDGDTYWISTDNGLHELTGNIIQRYTTDQGLSDNSIASVELDNKGDLWIATFNGLSRRDRISGKFQNFYVEDGLPHNEFNRLGKHKDADGDLFFSTQNGVVFFNPDSLNKEIISAPLLLTGFLSFGRNGSTIKKSTLELNGLEEVEIPAGNKYFQLDVALLNYINGNENKYAYYLEGLESTWRPMSTIPFIQYNNLPAGTYTLHIKATSASGQWAKNTLQIRITVLEHFYQTTSFIVLLMFLFFGVLSVILRYRFLQDLKMERMRNQLSRDLHDEVGGVLSGIAMQMDVLEKRSSNDIKPFMKTLAQSSRNVVSKMRDVIWAVDSSKDTFEDLQERMKAFTLELLVPLDVTYNYTFKNIDKNKKLNGLFRQSVYLVFKEAMVNIIKHADASEVNICLTVNRKYLEMRISDNGKGFSLKPKSIGQGLKNMDKRAKQIGGTLLIEEGKNGGVILVLNAPL